MINKLLLPVFLVTLLSACSSLKQGTQTIGSIIGASIAKNKGENILLGSIAGGVLGGLTGQMITSQLRPY
ncbi:MAG: hypothetical protein V3V19_00825 [Cocleimonas sp.]